ncbi:DUF4344 domain-containing metallopeptidase [Nocardioides marmorisolisilvae]|uniref:Peptidase n=1 Tax=Nocardioides marmorisolisilvae TaxID=1542737 RepID=A0A3N0DZ82_9ACTN|nr:DUF4344 domain-containing metallopeptidase [Nocardioides marmorisolisilvae]RNL80909.1 hypothetical protein EFL95_00525 [Nocardioides marmorisolisilvae]
MRPPRGLVAPAALLIALTLAGCGSSKDTDAKGSPEPTKTAEVKHVIHVTYDDPVDTQDAGYVGQVAAASGVSPQAFAEEILKDGAIDDIAAGFSDNFALPTDLTIHVTSAEGSPNYDPSTKTVTIYYDFANLTGNIIKAGNPKMSDADLGTQWAAVNDFVLVHELGHAFVDVFEIPITGREEDAVDGLATYFFTDQVPHGASYAFDAASFFHGLQDYQGAPDLTQFANEHSLSVQRAFDIACKVAGSSEETMQQIAALGVLPEDRPARCPGEYEQNAKAWSTLLKPHLRSTQD